MNSKLKELNELIKNGHYKTAFLKIIGWFSHKIDTFFYNVFFILPIRQNVILFRSTSDFSDNARVFYDYLIEHRYNNDYKFVWVLNNTNPRDYYASHNVKFIRFSSWHPVICKDYYYATAKCFIFTHISGMTKSRDGQILIHTSHSASQLKAPKEANNESKSKKDYTLACGPDGVDKKKISLGMSEERLPILGMPRLDLLYKDNDCLPILFNKYHGEKIILSMETFKRSHLYLDSVNDRDIYSINVVHSREELLNLDTYLKHRNAILIVKIHPMQDLKFLQFVNLDNIRFLTNQDLDIKGIQLYQLLEKTDILLTDYSSVFYDFLLLDRPIGFLIGDMEEYDRGFISDNPLDDMVGEKLYNFDDLIRFIGESLNGIDHYSEERKELRDRVFTYQDGNNCERLLEWMQKKNIIS